MCSAGLHTGDKINGRKGVVDTQGLRQKRGQAALTLTHHWMALCPRKMSHEVTLEP